MDNQDNQKHVKKFITIIGGTFCINIALIVATVFAAYWLYDVVYGAVNMTADVAFAVGMVLNAALMYVAPLIILGLCYKRMDKTYTHNTYSLPFGRLFIVAMFCLAYLAAFAGGLVGELILALTDIPAPFNDMPVLSENIVQAVSFYLTVIIIAPVCEELIFRKFILVPLRKLGDGYAVVISGLLFALFHMNLVQLPYAFLGGLVLGYAAVLSNGVVKPIIIHMLLNSFEVVRGELGGLGLLVLAVVIAGAGVFWYLSKRGSFKLSNEPQIPLKARLKLTFLNPLMIVCIIFFGFFIFLGV